MTKYVIGGVLLLISVWWVFSDRNSPATSQLSPTPQETTVQAQTEQPPANEIYYPISKASQRVTKKSFGTYVTPENSPVSPEKFKGYHTGVDFEIFAEETDVDVPIYAICNGPVLQKRTAQGFGGVLVQACNLDYQSVTVVYGHLDLDSIGKNLKENFKQGEQIGILGQPPSETDGERKHLHLSIHQGPQVDIKGYVPTRSSLSAWLDPMRFIK